MLTKLTIRNFKRFGEVEIELGSPVVFIGPNNSGKTSAMQRWRSGTSVSIAGTKNGRERPHPKNDLV